MTKKQQTTHPGIYAALTLGAFFVASLLPTAFADADAWWGKGYKPPSWVLANGGTIINSTTIGPKANNYKGVLRRNGKYVEVEFGKKMLFDDAKDGAYTITYYNCSKDCRYQETDNKTKIRANDSVKAVLNVVARPGQTVNVVFNTDTHKAVITSGGGKPVVKLTPEQITTASAKRNEGWQQDLSTIYHPAFLRMRSSDVENSQSLPNQVF